MTPPKRTSGGRRKIETKLIENENTKRATFSKRRSGIFKKATELSTLCGVQIGIIIFSMSGKPYSYGHPSIECVLNKFWNGIFESNSPQDSSVYRMRLLGEKVKNFKEQSDKMKEETKMKKKKRMKMHENLESFSTKISDQTLNELNIVELKELKEKMERLRGKIRCEINQSKSGNAENPNSKIVVFGQVEMNETEASQWLNL